jgi:hypothetical protein
MSETEEPQEIRTPENVWLSLEREQSTMNISLTPDQLRAMARSREKLDRYLIPSLVAVAFLIAVGLLYNVYRIDQPWIRVGQAWTLGVLVYLFAMQFQGRKCGGTDEPCVRFLERQHEERRSGYLRIKRGLFLFLPGIAACWWGRLPLADNLNVEGSSWLFKFYSESWLFLFIGIALTLVWLAFGKAADKAMRDRDDLLRSVGSGLSEAIPRRIGGNQ